MHDVVWTSGWTLTEECGICSGGTKVMCGVKSSMNSFKATGPLIQDTHSCSSLPLYHKWITADVVLKLAESTSVIKKKQFLIVCSNLVTLG